MLEMSSIAPNAGAWRTVAQLTQFPILAESHRQIKSQLKSSKASFENLAPIVEQDPALCLHLWRAVHQAQPSKAEQLTGVINALAMLGLEAFVHLVKPLSTVGADETNPTLILYRRALLTAHFASNLADEFAHIKGNLQPSYARWCTALSSAPFWLWTLVHPQTPNALYLMTHGHDIAYSVREVFGKKQEQNWATLAQALRLPAPVKKLYNTSGWLSTQQWRQLLRHDPRDLPKLRPLLQQCQQPHLIFLMANALAWHWHIAPESRLSIRWQRLISHWLGRSSFALHPLLRHTQLQTAQQQQSGEGSGLTLLLSPKLEVFPYSWLNPVGQPDTPPIQLQRTMRTAYSDKIPVPILPEHDLEGGERSVDEAYCKRLIRQLQQTPEAFGDYPSLLRGALKGLCMGYGIPGGGIALINRSRTMLKMVYTEGTAVGAPIQQLKVPLTPGTLFYKLLEKQQAALLDKSNIDKFLLNLPQEVKKLFAHSNMLMSLDAGQHTIGVVIAMAGARQAPFSQSEYINFKNLCIVTSHGLTRLRQLTEERQRQIPSD